MNELTLRWDAGGHSHSRVVAQGERVVVGRAGDADVRLPSDDRTIHRRHAEIVWQAGVPVVRALGQNGVGVDSHNGRLGPDQTAPLAADDRLQIGGVEVRTRLATTRPTPASGELKIRCHNCGRVCTYAPHKMCPHCGYALAGGQTVVR